MKKNISKLYTKLSFKIDRMSLRDRAITLIATILFILLIWNLLIYSPQSASLKQTKVMVDQQRDETMKLNNKRIAIEGLVQNNTISKLVDKYHALQAKMRSLEEETQRHQRRYITDKELATMLDSLVSNTSNVTIVEFYDMHSKGEQPAATTSTTKTTTSTNTTPAATPSAPATPVESNIGTKIKYKLSLKGDYFAILEFLEKIEKTHWQLYWDKMDYTVTKYPEANVVIEFYTLRPSEESLPHTEESHE